MPVIDICFSFCSATTNQETEKRSKDKNEFLPDEASTLECKKSLTKPKKRKKPKEVEEKKSTSKPHFTIHTNVAEKKCLFV